MTDLYVCVQDEFLDLYTTAADKYNNTSMEQRDSGFDVFCDQDYVINNDNKAVFLKFGILSSCAVKPNSTLINRAFWLMPRSSISKTDYICANSKGLIDSGYRGPLTGAIKMMANGIPTTASSTIKKETRLFQIVSGSAKPWRSVIVVNNMGDFPTAQTSRGSGGFGSTGI